MTTRKKPNRNKEPISATVDPKLLDDVQKWIDAQPIPATRTWVIETALREFLGSRKA